VPASTIHHYRARGLLPGPAATGAARSRYGDEHLQALLIIRRLRERRGLSLDRIAEILPELMASQHEAFQPAMWDRLLEAHASDDPIRAALVEAALAEFTRHSLDDVAVADLCAAAGVGKGTFYRYFDSKEEAFVAAAEAAAAQVGTAVVGARADRALRADSADEVGVADLREALGPVLRLLPVLLELATRASRGTPPFAAAASRSFRELAERMGDLGGEGRSLATLAKTVIELKAVELGWSR
jgi:AcrR family transcriptional regulator